MAKKDWLCTMDDTRKRIHTSCSHLVFKAFTQINLFTLSTEPATDAMSFSSPMYVPWPLLHEEDTKDTRVTLEMTSPVKNNAAALEPGFCAGCFAYNTASLESSMVIVLILLKSTQMSLSPSGLPQLSH